MGWPAGVVTALTRGGAYVTVTALSDDCVPSQPADMLNITSPAPGGMEHVMDVVFRPVCVHVAPSAPTVTSTGHGAGGNPEAVTTMGDPPAVTGRCARAVDVMCGAVYAYPAAVTFACCNEWWTHRPGPGNWPPNQQPAQ